MKKRFGAIDVKIVIAAIVGLAVGIGILAIIRLDTTGKKGSGLGPEYDYNVSEYAKIDPNLILYKESEKPISTGLAGAKAIFVDSGGLIYVTGDKAIRVFDAGGAMVRIIELTGAPRCLAVADNGKIYTGMKDHVEIYNGQGKPLAVWQDLGTNAVLTSIALWKDDVFVADAGNRIVLHYDISGKLIKRIGRKDIELDIPGFVIPSPYFDLAVGSDGLLRVTNPGLHRIEAYTFAGDLEFSWGKFSSGVEGFCGCCNPVNFAILADGSFVTCEKGLVRVKIYSPDGSFVGVVAGPEQLVSGQAARICETVAECQVGGFDVAVDSRGTIYVLDTIKNMIRTFVKAKAE